MKLSYKMPGRHQSLVRFSASFSSFNWHPFAIILDYLLWEVMSRLHEGQEGKSVVPFTKTCISREIRSPQRSEDPSFFHIYLGAVLAFQILRIRGSQLGRTRALHQLLEPPA